MIVSVDGGYHDTKYYNGKKKPAKFRSTILEGINELNKDKLNVIFEGKEYTLGEQNGLYCVDNNRIDTELFKICMYTAIGKMVGNKVEDIELVTGLPSGRYDNQKDELQKSLLHKKVNITIEGKPKAFTIKKCIVFPQSAGLFLLEPNFFKGYVIVIDIGGVTVDVSVFHDFTLIDHDTFEAGMINLNAKVVGHINNKYGLQYPTAAADDIIKSNSANDEDGKEIDVTEDIKEVFKHHMAALMVDIQSRFKEFSISKKKYIGGGAIRLREFIKGEVKDEDVYANVKAFYRVGEESFGKAKV